jgi:hypothetical protein
MSVLPNDAPFVPPHQYNGTMNMTKSGLPCRVWRDAIFDFHNVSYTYYFPSYSLDYYKNYCRDPLRKGYIWCFTTNPMVGFAECALKGLLFDFSTR